LTVNEGSNANFTITRSGITAAALVVDVTITQGAGTTLGDYTLTGGSISGQSGNVTVTIPVAAASVNVNMAATDDIDAEPNNTLTLTVTDGAAYDLGTPVSSTATIPANDLVVTNTNDAGEGSLRQAITNANAFASNDTITFSVSGTIGLTSALPSLVTAATAGTLTINGGGAVTVTRSSSTFRIFIVNSGANVTLNGLTITNGLASNGGGILNNGGTLTVTNSTLSGNTATAGGGGGILNNGGTLTVTNSTLSGNTATSNGGGIFNNGTLTVTNSTLSGNTANGGGGIASSGTTTVTNSTLSGNSATASGGGIGSSGLLTVTGSTLSGNSATDGGGIGSSGALTVTGSYLFNNTAVTGDGVYSLNGGSVTNTCLVGNGDIAVINTMGMLTATGNWWGTSWGPNIPAAPALTGSVVSSGDSIDGTGEAASSVDVGIVTVPTDYGTYSVSPIGNWLLVAPAGCPICTNVSGNGTPRVCIVGRP